MALSPEHRKRLLQDTKDIAVAFIEDEEHIRKIIQTEHPSRSEIRILSNLLRRLLVNRELAQIASPRISNLRLIRPSLDDFYRAARDTDVWLFNSGCPELAQRFSPLMFQKTESIKERHPVTSFQFRTTETTKPDLFLSQRVLCLNNHWISRLQTIKYAAICASGVHSEQPKTKTEKTLAKIRHALTYKQDGSSLQSINMSALLDAPFPIIYEQDRIDVVLVELLAAAFYMCHSPNVEQLVGIIRNEFGMKPLHQS